MSNQYSSKLNIVVYSSTFSPNVGGLEYMMKALSRQWALSGHNVTVITPIPVGSDKDERFTFNVIRTNSIVSLFKIARKADVFVEANISLKTALVGCLLRKKWWVIHHVHYQHGKTMTGKLKNILTYISKNISVSHFIARTIYGPSCVIHNCYNDALFFNTEPNRISNSIIYVGRIVSDKGVKFLIECFEKIYKNRNTAKLTIVGEGSQLSELKDLVLKKQLLHGVFFLGVQTPENIASLYQEHEIVIVPSIWEEPFGVIVLEALASGCKVFVSDIGGLSEAGREFVEYFEPLNEKQLVNQILNHFNLSSSFKQSSDLKQYLSSRTEKNVAHKYIELFSKSKS